MTDIRTLGEIQADDIENLAHVIYKECIEYSFRNKSTATEFVGQCLFARLGKLGVTVNGQVHPKFVDRMLRKHGVKVENRHYDDQDDKWREGIYIYKGREIVGFISHPKPLRSKLLFFIRPRLIVRTNIEPERV